MFYGPQQTNLFQPLTKQSSVAHGSVGTLYMDSEGNAWRYCKAGSSAVTAGHMVVSPSATANHINKAPAMDVAIGDKVVRVTVGATAVTADQYAGGYLQVNDGTSEGKQYRIEGNTACDASGTTIVQLAEPVRTALTTTGSEVSLIPSPFSGVAESADEENVPVGVALTDVTAAYYFWAQSRGVATTLVTGTPAVGSILTLGSTAGSVTTASTTIATTVTQPIVGTMFATAGVTTEYKPVKLAID